jgi:hypothetical protein
LLLVAASALLVPFLWPGLASFVADDDDTWIEWASRPWSELLDLEMPYETVRPAFALLLAAAQRAFGEDYTAYRLAGYGFHVLAVLLVFWLARPRLGDRRATLAALLFLVAPVHHESLFWISGLPDALSGTCVLAALVLFQTALSRLDSESRWSPAVVLAGGGAALAGALGALFKETGLVVSLLLPAWALVDQETGKRSRKLAFALAVVLPALAMIPLFVFGPSDTFRLQNALARLPERVAWILPGLAALVWPVSPDELRTQIYWRLGASTKWWVLLASAAALVWLVSRRRFTLPRIEVRQAILLLAVGMIPFLFLSWHRLLYLAPAGLAMLLLALPRRAVWLTLVWALLVLHPLSLRHQAILWAEATEVGRRAWEFLDRVPESDVLLVDYPLDVGGVFGSGAGVHRAQEDRLVEYLAPLRVRRATGWAPSEIVREGSEIVIRRPVRWGEHLNYPCDVKRMRQTLATIRPVDCRGDASPALRAAGMDIETVGLYRFDGEGFVRVGFGPEEEPRPDPREELPRR